jgi:hypothetical protein
MTMEITTISSDILGYNPSNYAYIAYMSKWKLEPKAPQWLLLVQKSLTNLTGHLFGG